MNERVGGVLYVVVVTIAVLVSLGMLAASCAERSDCSDRGGTYVRTMFWYECIGGR